MKSMYQSKIQSQEKPQKTNKKVQEARAFFESHAPSYRLMWGHALWMTVRVGIKTIYASQQYYADRGDIGRSQANKNLHVTKRHGLLIIRNRGYKKTCLTSIPQEYLHPTVLLGISDLFPWLYDHVRYALLINCSQTDYSTQVLYKNKIYNYNPTLTLKSGVTNYENNSLATRASPLPGSDAHEPSIVLNNFLKREDYEQFAEDIGGCTDSAYEERDITDTH